MDDFERQQQEALQTARASDQEDEDTKTKKPKEKAMGWFLFIILLIVSVIGDAIELFTAGTIGWLSGLLIDGILLRAFVNEVRAV